MIAGRKNWREELKSKVNKGDKYIWFHCASLGEFEQGRPLIEKYKKENPDNIYKVVLSFFSPSGYDIRKNYEYADIVCYLPFDTKKNAHDFVEIINPEFAVFVKYEFWYHMIKELETKSIPSFLISGIFRKDQVFFKKLGKSYLKCIKSFKYLFIQDKISAEILNNHGIKNTLVCGDTRTDRVVQIAKEEYRNTFLESFSEHKPTLVCGSTWPEDEKLLFDLINTTTDFNYIIAPHEIHEKHLSFIEQNITKSYCRLSNSDNINSKEVNVIIVDSIGLLSKIYRYGEIAFIGGGFGKGIHNTLEAVAYEIPVLFGPNYKNFKEAVDLVEIEAAFVVENTEKLHSITKKLINHSNIATKSQYSAKQYIQHSFGATQQIFDKMHVIVEKNDFSEN